MKKNLLFFLLSSSSVAAQNYTPQDTLKGSNTGFRNFWDVKKYEITVEPDNTAKTVKGSVTIRFEISEDVSEPVFQIDLHQPMTATLQTQDIGVYSEKRVDDFIFLKSKKNFTKGSRHFITFDFSGSPQVAKRAPWDGGWVFTQDEKGRPWSSVAQEGAGTSLWLPSKDIWSDEPEEGMSMKIITPKNQTGVGNGRLISKTSEKNKNSFTWEVKNPINLYSLVPNVGNYVNIKDVFQGESGKIDLEYWVQDYNIDKAKRQFAQVKPMLEIFEYWFGPYPFYKDSYKLVESPYLGMEHQSSVAYGNGFKNGYLGRDLSGTGVGLLWDFIIIHESAHEWFANNITAKDQADMWIHESFTCYAETLFTEKYISAEAAQKYIIGLRNNILNDKPIIGAYGVRSEGSGDMYYKGANMLHTIRQIINDDTKFREILRGLNRDFRHQTVTTKQIESYISGKSGIDFSTVFDQYLRTVKIPSLEYQQLGNKLKFRYVNGVKNLRLPLRVNGNQTILPSEEWQMVHLQKMGEVDFDENYYVNYVVSN